MFGIYVDVNKIYILTRFHVSVCILIKTIDNASEVICYPFWINSEDIDHKNIFY